MFKKIIVPTDGSEFSRRAFSHALELSRNLNSEIILLHVAATPEALGYVLSPGEAVVQERPNVNSEYVLTNTQKDIDTKGVKLISKLKPGQPAAEILKEIENNDIDLVVMGTHGYGPITGSLMGSVSQKVLIKTKVPVLLVK